MIISKGGRDTQIYLMQKDVNVLHPVSLMLLLLSAWPPKLVSRWGTNKYVIVTGSKCLKNYLEVMGTYELWVSTGDLQKLIEMIWKGLWYIPNFQLDTY